MVDSPVFGVELCPHTLTTAAQRSRFASHDGLLTCTRRLQLNALRSIAISRYSIYLAGVRPAGLLSRAQARPSAAVTLRTLRTLSDPLPRESRPLGRLS